uniref:Mbeg1-like protein n=1 Tax=Streptococcus ferus TaxID=1345 RepID=UPI0035A0E8D3
MTNFCDYVKQNSRNSFADLPLNEVDIACLNELAYLPLGDWLGQEQLALDKVALGQFRDYEKTLQVDLDFLITKERWNLFQAVLDSKRFEQLHLSYYTNEVSSEFERQFAAMMLEIPEIGHRQLIFRGTDDSLIGWKEDFQMTYMREIPAQRLAVTYLKHYLETTEGQLIISGHSKGGNLALYAASQQSSGQQERIQQIYLFDAPGLHQTVLSSPGYLAVRGKVVAIR